MRKIGIVGLGIMGRGIAENFLGKNHHVFVWNRTTSVSEEFGKRGAIVCSSPEKVAKSADIVFEVTANDESSREVWLGNEGIIAGANPDKFLVACATLSSGWVDALAQECKSRGFVFFDAALTGGRIGAETGSLTLLCGGDEKLLDELRPDLSAISKGVLHFGPAGQGMRYKLILNFLQATHMAGFNQAMKIAKSQGMDLKKVSDALVERPGGVITSIAKKAYFTEPDPATFSVEWLAKDLGYVREMAGHSGGPLLDAVFDECSKAVKAGLGKKDWAMIGRSPADGE
ncbi:MAG: NAD(P)-dependent oxidoreductase [archaeon]